MKNNTGFRILLIMFIFSAILRILLYFVSKTYLCDICFEYPEWWNFVYIIKSVLVILFSLLAWGKKKTGLWGLIIVGLFNAITLIYFEYNILIAIGYIFSIVLVWILKGEYKEYS